MAARSQPLLEHVRRLAARLDPEADAVLLERFVRQRDSAAFEALVHRHGAMVLGVCRRLLGNDHDAEDVFQATFLVLARKAAGGHPPDSLPAWLHGTAHRLALKRRQTAEECIRGKHWNPALWHLDQLIEKEPGNWLDYARRGLVRAELERWPEASADFAEVVRRAPDEREAWCLYALLRVNDGDAAGYRRACAALLERQEKSDDPRAAYLTAWTCVLSPDADVKGERLVELAKRVVDWQPDDPDYLCLLGAALFRAGDLEGAVRQLNEALALRGRRAGAQEWLWLALVRYRMGSPVEARQWLDKVAPTLANADSTSLSWVQRLQLGLLRREAERLLKSDKTSGK